MISQLDKLARHNRHGSFKTRERYYDAMKRFCAFLADSYRLGKLSNISSKHIEAYVYRLKGLGRSTAYIKTELSAIRLFHDLIPNPRYILPSNNSLDLERRRYGDIDRTWSDQEYEGMLQQAFEQGRSDYTDMLMLIRHTGLRLHECARLDTATAEGALRTGILTVKGKGGKIRRLPVDTTALDVLHRRLRHTRRGCKLFIPDGVKTDVVMSRLEQFIIRNRPSMKIEGAKVTAHGLRHTWTAEQYLKYIAEGQTPYETRKQMSKLLGHEREAVTNIYLASLSADEKKGGGVS